jgi:SagB-type dehydrogenase family enzyme
VRRYSAEPLTLVQISQLLWSLQGVTSPSGFRTAPSAGALYPLEIYAVVPEGCYRYEPRSHRLLPHLQGDLRRDVYRVSLQQESILQAPATFVLCAVHARIEREYGEEKGYRYTCMEIGHAAQNLHLQAVALGLGSVPMGAFHGDRLRRKLKLPADHDPLYLVPVGVPS